MTLPRAATGTAPNAWLEALSTAYPVYAVDMDQRITYWDARAASDIASSEDALGRHCYDVLPSLDPRNARRCRPNCYVIAMARTGHAVPDFEVWGPINGDASQRMDISILLHAGASVEDTTVVHLVRCPGAAGDAGAVAARDLCTALSAATPATYDADCSSLTSRQLETLRLLAEGRSPAEIASVLNVRPITVRNHIQAAMDRIGARTRLEAIMLAARAGLL